MSKSSSFNSITAVSKESSQSSSDDSDTTISAPASSASTMRSSTADDREESNLALSSSTTLCGGSEAIEACGEIYKGYGTASPHLSSLHASSGVQPYDIRPLWSNRPASRYLFASNTQSAFCGQLTSRNISTDDSSTDSGPPSFCEPSNPAIVHELEANFYRTMQAFLPHFVVWIGIAVGYLIHKSDGRITPTNIVTLVFVIHIVILALQSWGIREQLGQLGRARYQRMLSSPC